MLSKLRFGLIIIAAFAVSTVRADGGFLPPERTQGSVTFVNGGIGQDESEAMKQAASRYSLAIELASTASPRAEYLSDVQIDVRDQKGAAIFSAGSLGPLLLANLPAGRYVVTATRNGKSQKRDVVVGPGAHAKLSFAFPE
jgi:hypothetical protein